MASINSLILGRALRELSASVRSLVWGVATGVMGVDISFWLFMAVCMSWLNSVAS